MVMAWSVPGRVNLIGEHLDYNGGPVLPFAVDRRVDLTASPRGDDTVAVRSEGVGRASFAAGALPGEVAGWERYVAGALWAFAQASGRPSTGYDITITSTLPNGAGLSSSAAVECAVICAVDEVRGTGLSRREIAALALRAEREYVGVPCGPMDQLAVMLAEPEHALLLDSRTLETELVPLDLTSAGLTVLVVDTQVRHALADGSYANRRAACEAAAAGLGVATLVGATLAEARSLTDATQRRRAMHVVSEVERVHEVVALLRAGRLGDIGPLLTASHRSLADDFEVSCPELDLVVETVLSAGALGARMTGAGLGGAVIALCRTVDADGISDAVRDAFQEARLALPDSWSVVPAAGAFRR